MRLLFIGFVLVLNTLCSFQVKGQDIDASMTAKQYAYKDSLTLVDLYFKISSNQLQVRDFNGEEFVDVEVLLYLSEDGKDAFEIGDRFKISLKVSDMTDEYIYSKQSYLASKGMYKFHIEMKDANAVFEPTISEFDYEIEDKQSQMISDIFCYEHAMPADKDHPFYKSGFAIYPKFQSGNYLFNVNDSVLNYYVEIYDVESDKELFIERYIKGRGSNFAIKSTYTVKNFTPSKRKIESKSMSIAELPSGNYELVISVFDSSKKQLVNAKVPFQKISRVKKEKETVVSRKEHIRKLYKKALFEKHGLNDVHRLNQFIAAMALREEKTARRIFYNAIDNQNLEEKENFFLSYWEEKDRLHPQFAIEEFANTFDAVQDKFSFRGNDGYQTEKGRVYLEYGKPDDIQLKSKDQNSVPFEIWHYYKLKSGQGNVIFVFQERNSSGEYQLFHSNATGEVENPNWRNILQSIEGSVIGN